LQASDYVPTISATALSPLNPPQLSGGQKQRISIGKVTEVFVLETF